MDIQEQRLGGQLVLTAAGRLDSTSAPLLDRKLSALIERGDRMIVIDLTAVDYISSVGLSVFLGAARKLKPLSGRLALVGLNTRIRLVFEMSGFLRLFPVFPTVEQALA